MMLLGYAVYVKPEEDYPVAQFRRKVDQKDNAIGYQKTAMVFHVLRQEIGDEVFWKGVRELVRGHAGRYARWREVEEVFARAAGQNLRHFFSQWIERSGAPTPRLIQVRQTAEPGSPEGSPARRLQITLAQGTPFFRLRVPVTVTLSDGSTRVVRLAIERERQTSEISTPLPAARVAVDAEHELFRRIPRSELPPMLNLYATDEARMIVTPGGGDEETRRASAEWARHIVSRSPGTKAVTDSEPLSAEGSLLILGGPDANRAARPALQGCGGHVTAEADRFTVDGRTYEGSGTGLLVSCPRPGAPGRVATVFYGLSPAAAAKVSRLLFFYGWQSYVVFRDGQVVARGDFPVAQEGMEVAIP
jgi:hypothetical protein